MSTSGTSGTSGTSSTSAAGAGSRRATTSAPQRRGPAAQGTRISRNTWVDLAVFAALMAVAIIGFGPAFGHSNYLVAAFGGLIVGGGAAVLGRVLRVGIWSTIAMAVVAYVVFGTPLALPSQALLGVLPSLDSLAGLVRGAVFGWSDAVTLHAPIEAPPYVSVVPYAATWVISLVAVSVACRWMPRAGLALVRSGVLLAGPMLLLLATILLGTRDPYFAAVRGVAFAAIALGWLGWRRRASRTSISTDSGLRRKAVIGSGIVVAVAVVAGALGGAVLAPADADRFVVRDAVAPPFNPLDYPAPLAGFRKYTKSLEKTKLFTVSGLEDGQLIRLATMDSYDGVVWSVAGPDQQTNGSGSFQLLGSTIPQPPLFTAGTTSKATFTVDDYKDVWLPNLGYVDSLKFDSYKGTDPATTVRVNTTTGTTAVTSGVSSKLSYTLDVTAQKLPNDKKLKNVPVATLDMPSVTDIPDVVAAKATEYAGGSASAIQKLRNIERSLKKLGYLSHGRASDPVPSRAGEGADRMTDLLSKTPMVGDQEQYASAFALMARHLGYPVRVVMGFKPKVAKGASTATLTGNEVTAWDEVAFQGVGWVPFFPTPDKTDAPKNETVKPKLVPQPQVRQPPRTEPKADELLTPVKTKDSKDKKKPDEGFAIPAWAWYTGGGILLLALIYVVPLLIIAARKARRRRSRQAGTGDRSAAGAWSELVDRYVELGFTVSPRDTRTQTAHALDRQSNEQSLPLPDSGFGPLATDVDEAVFDGTEVTAERSDGLWARVDGAVKAATGAAGWLRRRVTSFRFRGRAANGGERASSRRSRGRPTRPGSSGSAPESTPDVGTVAAPDAG